MLEPLGLEAGANKRQVAAKLFERASEEETEADTEMYKIVLADGTETLLRFQAKKVPWLGDIPGRVFSSLFQKEAKLTMCSVCRRAIIHIIYMLMCKATWWGPRKRINGIYRMCESIVGCEEGVHDMMAGTLSGSS